MVLISKKKVKHLCSNCQKLYNPNIACPKCKSDHTVGHGDTMTVKKGIRPRMKCQDCGHTFYIEEIKGEN